MRHLERILVDLDNGPSGAVCRVTLGLSIPPKLLFTADEVIE